MTPSDPINLVAFQGEAGANSDLAARAVFPGVPTLPCRAFEDAFAAVEEGKAERAMIPIENSVAGRVADVHHLLPRSKLFVVGEHFQRVRHQLLGPKGATLAGVKRVHSHIQALQQCRGFLRAHGMEPVVHADTAGAAAEIARTNNPAEAAIASSLAGEIYGLDTLAADIEDADHNTTRFLVLSPTPDMPDLNGDKCITSLVFRVRNVPAALYKVLGGFATNGVNLTKLESYMVDGRFVAAQFYADAEGHPDEKAMRLALEEMKFFTREMRVLGTYPASPFRSTGMAADGD